MNKNNFTKNENNKTAECGKYVLCGNFELYNKNMICNNTTVQNMKTLLKKIS